jgi:hypothetical protein
MRSFYLILKKYSFSVGVKMNTFFISHFMYILLKWFCSSEKKHRWQQAFAAGHFATLLI